MQIISRSSHNQNNQNHVYSFYRRRRNSAPGPMVKLEPFEKARQHSKVAIITSDDVEYRSTGHTTPSDPPKPETTNLTNTTSSNELENEATPRIVLISNECKQEVNFGSNPTLCDHSTEILNPPKSKNRPHQNQGQVRIASFASSTSSSSSTAADSFASQGNMGMSSTTTVSVDTNDYTANNNKTITFDAKVQEQMENIRNALETPTFGPKTIPEQTSRNVSTSTLGTQNNIEFQKHHRRSSSENASVDILDLYRYNQNSGSTNSSMINNQAVQRDGRQQSSVTSVSRTDMSSPAVLQMESDEFETLNGYPEITVLGHDSLTIDQLLSNNRNGTDMYNTNNDPTNTEINRKEQTTPMTEIYFDRPLRRRHSAMDGLDAQNQANFSVELEMSPRPFVSQLTFFYFFKLSTF